MVYKRDIESAVDSLDLSNSKVCIHASMKSFEDDIEGGIESIVNTFLNRSCTVMVPTFSKQYEIIPVEKHMPERNGIDYNAALKNYSNNNIIYSTDSKIISENMGAFSKFILNSSGSIRGNHQLNSFTAIGTAAHSLIDCQTSKNVYAPLEQLCDFDGFVLLIGVGLDKATIIHYAEQKAGRNLFVRWAYDSKQNAVPVSIGSCSRGFKKFEHYLKAKQEVFVGKSLWRCFRAKDMADICSKLIIENPQITHCDDLKCERCNDVVLGGPVIDFIS